MESMQTSLEAEAKGKAEAQKIKKKLEADINELEMALDGSNRARAELEKTVKRYQNQVKVRRQDTVSYKSKGVSTELKIVWMGFPLYSSIKELYATSFWFHDEENIRSLIPSIKHEEIEIKN